MMQPLQIYSIGSEHYEDVAFSSRNALLQFRSTSICKRSLLGQVSPVLGSGLRKGKQTRAARAGAAAGRRGARELDGKPIGQRDDELEGEQDAELDAERDGEQDAEWEEPETAPPPR